MKLAPLKHYRRVEYPTQEILNQHPELLRVLPRRWHSNPVVLGTLAGLLALMEQSIAMAQDKQSLRVAPIFVHGEGRAAIGGDAAYPLVLLTEAEARKVIEEEASKAGLEFSTRDHKLRGVDLPITDEFVFLEKLEQQHRKFLREHGKKPANTNNTSKKGDLELGGWNPKLQTGYKFLALKDFQAWERKDNLGRCTVSVYDMLDTARRLQVGLRNVNETGAVAVFYEPVGKPSKDMEYPRPLPTESKDGNALSKEEKDKAAERASQEYWKQYDATAKKVGEEQLRSQVKDFLAWLKAQGVM